MGLDVGTGTLHCLLTDSLGRPISSASAPMCYFTPEGCSYLAKEFNPDTALDALGRLVGQVMKQSEIKSRDITAIGITSQRQGTVFLDEEGREIYSGPNIDLRALFEGAAIDEELGSEIYATTGHFPSLLLAPARLRWFRGNRPGIYEKVRTILTIASWLAYRLTGCLASEPSLEAEAGLLDIIRRERSPNLMGKLDVSLPLLPPLTQEGIPSSGLSSQMSTLLGLRPGIPVVIAGPDTQCGLLGMGLVKAGQLGAVIGWSGALQVLTSRPRLDGEMRTWVGCQPQGNLWVSESNIGEAGSAYKWLKDILLDSNTSFDEAELLAQQASGAPEGVSAFLGPGPMASAKAGLTRGGLSFPTPLSFQETTRGQLLRAALENITYSVKSNLDVLRQVTDLNTEVLYLGGGMSNSRTLAASLANVLGFPVRRSHVPQVSARGAALAAAWITDSYLSLEQAAEAVSEDYDEVEPDSASAVSQYQDYYCQWLHLYEHLQSEEGRLVGSRLTEEAL